MSSSTRERRRFTCILVIAIAAATVSTASATELSELIAPDAEVRKIAGDFRFTEGPADNGDGMLLFSDIPNDRIVELVTGTGSASAAGGASTGASTRDFLTPSGRANGLMFDKTGALYACRGGARHVSRIDVKTKKITPVATSFDGKKLNSPNDLALDGSGGLYFTDPRYGRGGGELEQPVMGVYHVAKDGKVTRVIDSLERPNGILVSPDGKTLYVAEPNKREIWAFTIQAPGKLADKRLIYTGDAELDGGGPDGMAHDVHGNIYATYQGIVVLDPAGKLIGRIKVPERPANCTIGGPQRKTLYITARTSLYAVELKVQGQGLRAAGPGAKPSVATIDVKTGDITLALPASWKHERPSNRFRLAQYVVPAAKGDTEDAEFIVSHLGGGDAGGVKANIDRWIGQFEAEGRKSSTADGKVALGDYALVEIEGTYKKPDGPPFLRKFKLTPGSTMLAAMVITESSGTYYLKLVGPTKTVSAQRAAFLASFGKDR